MPRYYVGIDLGTTNTVVYFIDTALDEVEPQIFKIPQRETRKFYYFPVISIKLFSDLLSLI